MNRFLIMAAAVLAVGVLAAGASAQGVGPKGGAAGGPKTMQGRGPGGPGGPGGGDRMAEFKKRQDELYAKLKVTPAQKKKLDALSAQQMKDAKALMDAPGDRQSKMGKFQEMRKKNLEAVKKILTPAQFKQLEKIRAEQRAKMGGGPGGGMRMGGPGGPGGKGGPGRKGGG